MQGFASAVFKHKAALRKQSGAAQAAGKNILFACLSMLLYHRNAAFAMNAARTKPIQYTTETQLNNTNPYLFCRTFRRPEFGRAFALCQRRAGILNTRISLFFKNPRASLCGQTFDTPFPLSLFCPPKGAAAENSMEIVYIRWDFLSDIAGVCSETRSLPFLLFQSG